ncbi:hypothetical protein D3H55_23550 [Bacillus salacetis]|uniref:Uncharacterized protein n=1 Tax=Bacillus salacetis TaxID=2315464 RepID=A0A3A1QMM0_9BACI|nr:hypothetical protein [Bacillus salacetis]RIW26641.1 hypothetical protein D3H55_23550 [Bacillus salacetis]
MLISFYFIVVGLIRQFEKKPTLFISRRMKNNIPQKDLPVYAKHVGRVQILTGVIIGIMSQIEYWYNP